MFSSHGAVAFSEKAFVPTFYGASKEDFVKKVNQLFVDKPVLQDG